MLGGSARAHVCMLNAYHDGKSFHSFISTWNDPGVPKFWIQEMMCQFVDFLANGTFYSLYMPQARSPRSRTRKPLKAKLGRPSYHSDSQVPSRCNPTAGEPLPRSNATENLDHGIPGCTQRCTEQSHGACDFQCETESYITCSATGPHGRLQPSAWALGRGPSAVTNGV